MILSSFADTSALSIKTRLRVIYILYFVVLCSGTYLSWFFNSDAADLRYFYDVAYVVGIVFAAWAIYKPRIGMATIYLFPFFFIAIVRLIDLWQNYFSGHSPLEVTVRGALGWSAILIFILFIDLLESKIYHRLVAALDEEID